MLERLTRIFTIWRLRRRIARQRQRLRDLSMEYFTMEGALLRDKINQDESRLVSNIKELHK